MEIPGVIPTARVPYWQSWMKPIRISNASRDPYQQLRIHHMASQKLHHMAPIALLLCLTASAIAQRPPSAMERKTARPTGNTSVRPAQSTTAQPIITGPRTLPLTIEKAFLYSLAISGTSPDAAVERYASYFDNANYNRAMADEFQRVSYIKRMTSILADQIAKVNYGDQFVFEGAAAFGEYSFDSHSFPLVSLPQGRFDAMARLNEQSRNRATSITDSILLNTFYFRPSDVVNKKEFSWSIPMAESEASAFIKGRTGNQPSVVNRSVTVRFTYSIMSWSIRVDCCPPVNTFFPYVHSIEIYGDEARQKKLATLTPKPGTPIASFLPEMRKAAQSSTRTINTYSYRIGCRDFACQSPTMGTITLTDVGFDLSENSDTGSSAPQRREFLDLFSAKPSGMTVKLHRRNGVGDDFGVTWESPNNYSAPWGWAGIAFTNVRERDRFWVDLTAAISAWNEKYPQFVLGNLLVDQQCLDAGNYWRPCPVSGAPTDSANATPKTIAVLPPERVVLDAFDAYTAGDADGVTALMSKEGLQNAKSFCSGLAATCLDRNYGTRGKLQSRDAKTESVSNAEGRARVKLITTWQGGRAGLEMQCQDYRLILAEDGWRISFFSTPSPCSEVSR